MWSDAPLSTTAETPILQRCSWISGGERHEITFSRIIQRHFEGPNLWLTETISEDFAVTESPRKILLRVSGALFCHDSEDMS